MHEVMYPEGTPEYEAYAAKLREELRKFTAGEYPYEFEPKTPAAARTGISDRAAAALNDVADLRRDFNKVDYREDDVYLSDWFERLDRIEAALRIDHRVEEF